MQGVIKKIVKVILPAPLYHALRSAHKGLLGRLAKNYQARYPARKDVSRYKVQQGVYFDVFWKVLSIGKGPAVSLFVYGDEVLKFDCFGRDKGHCHIAFYTPGRTTESRLYFSEKTVDEQIERTIFELRTNLCYYLQRHRKGRTRSLKIDLDNLNIVCNQIYNRMHEYLMTVPQLKDLRETIESPE